MCASLSKSWYAVANRPCQKWHCMGGEAARVSACPMRSAWISPASSFSRPHASRTRLILHRTARAVKGRPRERLVPVHPKDRLPSPAVALCT
eukprot:scaffold86609_cov30-Tisochrysis_lutea.AAC.1